MTDRSIAAAGSESRRSFESHPQRSALVLVIDGLQAGFLGPYGNTWVDTPGWNRLATQSTLWECALADAAALTEVYDSYWSGSHAAVRRRRARQSVVAAATGTSGEQPSIWLPQQLERLGVQSDLLTDDLTIAQHAAAQQFRELLVLEQDAREETAADLDSTRIGSFLSATLEHWESLTQPSLLWCHSRGLNDLWDAPRELRERLADEEDPAPPELVLPVHRHLPERFDPDELLGISQAYGGQVIALDICLDAWLEEFQTLADARNTLLIVTAARSYPLGEHRRIGYGEESLHGELIHVPLLVRFPRAERQLERRREFAQPADLYATLLDWFAATQHEPPSSDQASIWGRSLLAKQDDDDHSNVAVAVADDQLAVRTPAWFLTERARGEEVHTELFAKPDDRWEANEIARRCPEIVEQLRALGEAFELGDRAALPVLNEVLVSGLE
ncbi:MAG: sulfatase-like hydrolase/transferase [Planctomycetota bacterium]